MRRSYIDYAMSVIVSRALPDVRDGLKPVHRRILFAMHDTGNAPDRPYRKSARLVGDVLGRYHPHGDVAVYDAVVRLAQDFSTRYQLVDGHGNFGSVDGDPPAAMRYTEIRLARISTEMLRDIDKATVDFVPNFDETLEEPTVLPSRFPNLLVNGSSGIAVGMATNIPPHNLSEVIDGCLHLMDHPDATARDLMQHIKGPDFPTGALIVGREGIRSAYETGRGIVAMRAVAQIEPTASGKNRIIVTELPFQVNKAKLVERIAELVREKRLDGITDLRDESDRVGMRLVLELRRDANPRVLLNQLYKYTAMQQTFGIIMLALVSGRPRVLSLKETINCYLEHQKEVIVRRTRFELEKAEARAHILEGLRIALDNLDAVITLIRSSQDAEEAKAGLMSAFGLSEKQSVAILDLRLQRLTALEREKIDAEYEELLTTIAYLRAVLASEAMVFTIIRQELTEIKDKYGDERRSKIISDEGELEDEDLIAEEEVVITLTHQGYVKRLAATTYRNQRRGGRGITGMHTKQEDFVEHLFVTTTHHDLLFFTTKGRVFGLKAHELPEASRTAKGTPIINLISLSADEKITAVIPLKRAQAEGYLFMATRLGTVKKTDVSGFQGIRSNGLIALNLDENDALMSVRLTSGDEQMIVVTRKGLAIRFPESSVRAMGRNAHGVKGIRLGANDEVVAMEVVEPKSDLLLVTEQGFGKRCALPEFRSTGRAGKGIRAVPTSKLTGGVAGARVVDDQCEVMLISTQGVLIRIHARDISRQGRQARGVHVMRLDADDTLTAVAVVPPHDEEDA